MKNFIFKLFVDTEGDKTVPRKKNIKVALVVATLITVVYQSVKKQDDSSLDRSYQPLASGRQSQFSNAGVDERSSKHEFHLDTDIGDHNTKNKRSKNYGEKRMKMSPLIYSAKQVIERGADATGSTNAIPSGTNFIGKLLDGIDSRAQSSTARVTLPYGVSHPKGGSIPKNSVLLGQVNSGEGEKIFIRFSRVVFPSGEEFKIDAQALSSSDYSPGIIGQVHSNADLRLMGSMALTVVSAAADVLTQRSMVNVGGMPMGIGINQTEATTKNAVLQGVSQLSKEEAQRKMQSAQSAESYVTASSDSDLIVSLLSPFTTEGSNQ